MNIEHAKDSGVYYCIYPILNNLNFKHDDLTNMLSNLQNKTFNHDVCLQFLTCRQKKKDILCVCKVQN